MNNKIILYTCLISFYFHLILPQYPIIITSVPKCGTHLIDKLLSLLVPKKQRSVTQIEFTKIHASDININKYLLSHAMCNSYNLDILIRHQAQVFFIYRDPRDQVVSLAYHYKRIIPSFKQKPISDLITLFMHNMHYLAKGDKRWGDPFVKTLGNTNHFYQQYLPWINHPNFVYTTTFEKLVGAQGGGSLEEQLHEIKNIANHIGITLSDKQTLIITQKLFGSTHTFRQGKIGSWKTEFTDQHKKEFKEIAGQLLIDLGYETDYNW